MKNWYNLDPGDVFDELKTSASGLSGEEAKKRLAQCGENSLKSQKKTSWIMLLLMQFTDLMTLLLVGAAAVSGVIAAITRDGSDLVDTFIIIFIIFLNAIVGFIQQYRADKAIEKLKKMSEGEARVYRDGRLTVLPSRMLTPGDVIELKAGDVVPADCRIIVVNGRDGGNQNFTGVPVIHADDGNIFRNPVTSCLQGLHQIIGGHVAIAGECSRHVVQLLQ